MSPIARSVRLIIEEIGWDGTTVQLRARAADATASCPGCGTPSRRVHDRYVRHPQDVAWRGIAVRWHLTVRRFRCLVADCTRQTFAESFGTTLPALARRTDEVTRFLLSCGQIAGGEAGARLATAAGTPTSPDTILRVVRAAPADTLATPRVLGIDDLALRRGRHYATIFVDLENGQVVDLVKGREAEVVTTWLQAHPGVEIIARDRSGAYAEGARLGAPDARQVADRFHLVQNASQALDEVLRGRRRQLVLPPPEADSVPSATTASPAKAQQATRRARRRSRWERAHALRDAGVSISAIARDLEAGRKTIRRWLARPRLTQEGELAPGPRRARPSGLSSPTLQPYVSFLQDRRQAGCTNVTQLYREIIERGYSGSRSLLASALAGWRSPTERRGHRGKTTRISLRWLCLRPAESLTTDEQTALAGALADDADLRTGYTLLHQFRALVRARDRNALDRWMTEATASGLAPFQSFVNGLRNDWEAVEAAFALRWSTGPVEGHVHRVKLIKRQGYGRAKLDLLRQRVLAA